MEVSISFTPSPLYSQGKIPWYPLDRRLSGLQSRSGRGGELCPPNWSGPHNKQIPWRRVLEKLKVAQLVKKLLTCYIIRIFIIAFTRAGHWTLSWASWIRSSPLKPVSLRFILVSSSHLHLVVSSSQILLLKFCMHFSSFQCMLYASSISYLQSLVKSTNCEALHYNKPL
jgi:hypothetical protein